MQTSAQGVAFLERHEGVVLRAYRDVVGVWTIGAGLTAKSGVVKPRAGMVINPAEATTLLQQALRLNYEPAVLRAMPGARQHEFDGGVSFHWNTGAIGKASWVRAWIDRNWDKVASGLKAWNKGGGKVLPGLTRRRDEEFQLIRHGLYQRRQDAPAKEDRRYARIALPLSADEFASVRAALSTLGYDVGEDRIRIKRAAVLAFQADHGLTVDGIAGRATLSTLQRMLDARRKAAVTAPATSGGVAAGATGLGDQLAGVPYANAVLVLAGASAVLWLAWSYRDALAASVQRPLPRLAALLRSV